MNTNHGKTLCGLRQRGSRSLGEENAFSREKELEGYAKKERLKRGDEKDLLYK